MYLKQGLRLAVSAGVLVGSSFFAVKFLETQLTKLLVDSTVEALQDPEVEEEVYELFKKLLQRLLEDPNSRDKTLDFLASVLRTEKAEDAVLKLLVETMQSPEYRSEGLDAMREITQFVLRDKVLIRNAQNLSFQLALLAKYFESAKHFEEFASPRMLSLPTMRVPRIDFENLLNQDFRFLESIAQREQILNLSRTTISIPQLEVPRAPRISYQSPTPQLASVCESLLLDLNQLQAETPSVPALQPSEEQPSLESIERLYIKY